MACGFRRFTIKSLHRACLLQVINWEGMWLGGGAWLSLALEAMRYYHINSFGLKSIKHHLRIIVFVLIMLNLEGEKTGDKADLEAIKKKGLLPVFNQIHELILMLWNYISSYEMLELFMHIFLLFTQLWTVQVTSTHYTIMAEKDHYKFSALENFLVTYYCIF